MKKQLLIILFFPFLIFSQSNSDCDYKKEFDNGDVYEGCRDVEERRNGKGKYTWADGSYYNGEWVNNKKEGIGEYKLMNIIAFVETLETANSSLLGIEFLKKFSEVQWSLISNQLILYK